jgi:hypothetical protein
LIVQLDGRRSIVLCQHITHFITGWWNHTSKN